MTRAWRWLGLLSGAAIATLNACASPVERGADSCRTLEFTRCEALSSCPSGLGTTVESCKNFYDTQCARGLPDIAREPTGTELASCVAAIRASCDTARSPQNEPACQFLIAL